MRRDEKSAFWACIGGWVLDAMDVQMFSFAIPAIVATFSITNADAGRVATATLVASALGGWMAGALSDRIGRVRTLQITIAWFAVFTFLCGFAQSYAQLFAFRALMGLEKRASLMRTRRYFNALSPRAQMGVPEVSRFAHWRDRRKNVHSLIISSRRVEHFSTAPPMHAAYSTAPRRRLCRLNEGRLRLARRLGRAGVFASIMACIASRDSGGRSTCADAGAQDKRSARSSRQGVCAARAQRHARRPQAGAPPRPPSSRTAPGLVQRNRFRPSARFSPGNFSIFPKKNSPGRRADGPQARTQIEHTAATR
jgi:hypothetical protein